MAMRASAPPRSVRRPAARVSHALALLATIALTTLGSWHRNVHILPTAHAGQWVPQSAFFEWPMARRDVDDARDATLPIDALRRARLARLEGWMRDGGATLQGVTLAHDADMGTSIVATEYLEGVSPARLQPALKHAFSEGAADFDDQSQAHIDEAFAVALGSNATLRDLIRRVSVPAWFRFSVSAVAGRGSRVMQHLRDRGTAAMEAGVTDWDVAVRAHLAIALMWEAFHAETEHPTAQGATQCAELRDRSLVSGGDGNGGGSEQTPPSAVAWAAPERTPLGCGSWWRPFIDTLPRDLSSLPNNWEAPYRDVATDLLGSAWYGGAVRTVEYATRLLQDMVQTASADVRDLIETALYQQNSNARAADASAEADVAADGALTLSTQVQRRLHWAVDTLRARCFTPVTKQVVDEYTCMPFADAANHDDDAYAYLSLAFGSCDDDQWSPERRESTGSASGGTRDASVVL